MADTSKLGLPSEVSNLACPTFIRVGAKALKIWKQPWRQIFLKISHSKSNTTVYFIKLIIKVVWWRRVLTQTSNITKHLQLRRYRSRAFRLLRKNIKILYDTIDSGNDTEKQIILDKIQTELWPKFVNLSLQYYETLCEKCSVFNGRILSRRLNLAYWSLII